MEIKFLGHSCFLMTYNGVNILTDPFYNFQKEKSNFDISAQKIDYILITHAHEDHIADVQEVLQVHTDATLIGQPEICGYFKHSKNIDLNIGGTAKIGDLSITMVTAKHTSSFPNGAYGGEPAGYVLSYEGKNIYLAGDTGVTQEMALLPLLFGGIDLAILPIGGHYTMDAHQASFAVSELIKAKKVLACHFDTFPPISVNHQEVKNCFDKKGIEIALPLLGEQFKI